MAATASTRTDGPSACENCGAVGSTMGVMGLSVCSACGSVRSFMGDLRESARGTSAIVTKDMSGIRPRQLLRVPESGRALALAPISNEVSKAMQQAARVHRCRVAITRVSLAIQVQVSVIEPALNLMMRHCQRVNLNGSIPVNPSRLKCLSCACILVACSRQGLGVTMQEVAAKADQPLGNLRKKIWQVCMANGVRLLRNAANTTALLNRICDGFNLTVEHQRSAICAAASRLILIAEWGWVSTGRHWVYIVGAVFMLAAKAYHVSIKLDSLGEVLCIPTGTILKRVSEIQRILVSLLRDLPWGHMVKPANVHAYMHFALEFFEVLAPASVELRRQRLRLQDEAGAIVTETPASIQPPFSGGRGASQQEVSTGKVPLKGKFDTPGPRVKDPAKVGPGLQVAAELGAKSLGKGKADVPKPTAKVRRRQRRVASSSEEELQVRKRPKPASGFEAARLGLESRVSTELTNITSIADLDASRKAALYLE